MIKIRLHGTEEEINKVKTYFKKLETLNEINILSISEPYADRGCSKYYRLYMDAEITEEANEMKVLNIK